MFASRFTPAAAALILSLAALPTPSQAQASREGPTFAAAGAWPGFSLRYPDIAYDPVNDIYLIVSGAMTHGRFQTADGVPIGTNEFATIDHGLDFNLRVGTRFAVYRDLKLARNPLKRVGEGVAVMVGPQMTVVRITSARDALFAGDVMVPRTADGAQAPSPTPVASR